MTSSYAMNPSLPATIPSAQVSSGGAPRFQIPAFPDDPEWELAAGIEAAGGVSAEIRAFLDAQMETGDVLLDLAPGFGFVALSATTAPGGLPTVFVGGINEDRLQVLQDAAVDVGGWLESVSLTDGSDLAELLDTRLDLQGRVFVHVAAEDVAELCSRLRPLLAQERVLAICVTNAHASDAWNEAADAMILAGMTPCALVEQEGDVVMMRISGAPTAPVIALPSALAGDAMMAPEFDALSALPMELTEVFDGDHSDEVFPASFPSQVTPAATLEDADVASVSSSVPRATYVEELPRWNAMRDGLSLITSHTRTGYGVTGAHLLRALQQRGAPVTLFPIGPVDSSLTDNPQLQQALNLQDAYRPDVPSVRLAQQFDLAMHVGRGARVAFTIFELDTFTPREMHHLRSQDAIFVCSDWAREACLQNGLDETPIHIVPLGVDRAIFHENVQPKRSWSETVFMQVGKLEPRKGQLDLLRAFEAAFTPKDSVRLVLSCGNPFISQADLDTLLRPFRKSPLASKISLLTNELPNLRSVAELMAAADCGVFAARAEGWNLEALEMLSMGKQVIATDYSAHTEFLNSENARLIDIDAREYAHPGRHPGQWAAWGNAQHEQLVAHLRDVHAAKQAVALPLNTAGIATAHTFSWEGSADALIRSLYAIA